MFTQMTADDKVGSPLLDVISLMLLRTYWCLYFTLTTVKVQKLKVNLAEYFIVIQRCHNIQAFDHFSSN